METIGKTTSRCPATVRRRDRTHWYDSSRSFFHESPGEVERGSETSDTGNLHQWQVKPIGFISVVD